MSVLLVAAALAGCGGGDGDGEVADEAVTTTAAVAPETTAAGAPAGAPGTTASGTASTAGRTGGNSAASTTTGATTGKSPANTNPPPALAAGVKVTAPGTYTYGRQGSQTIGAGQPQPVDGDAKLTVEPAKGADQRQIQTAEGSDERILRFQGDGVYLVYNHIKSGPFDKEFRPEEPVLGLPRPAEPGRAWSWTMKSTDGTTTVDFSAKVVRKETVDVGGQQVACLVIEAVLKLSGDITSTTTATSWESIEHLLTVKDESRTEGTFGAFPFKSEVRSMLKSTKPA